MNVSVLLITHNDGPALARLLESLISCTPDDAYEVVIVDRGSTEPVLVELLESLTGDVVVVRSTATTTLEQAFVLGIDAVRTDVIALTSMDAHFFPGWLPAMHGTLLSLGPDAAVIDDQAAAAPLDALVVRKATALRAIESFPAPTSPGSDPVAHLVRYVNGHDGSLTTIDRTGSASAADPSAALPGNAAAAVPTNAWTPNIGLALQAVTGAVMNGAAIGELPLDAAELLRERLWAEEEHRLLQLARGGRDVCWTDEGVAEPLVTIRIPTYNRPEQLMEIALPSALQQTYENIEVLVIGDHTDEATIRAMASVKDPRVRFLDLPAPSVYPDNHVLRWFVAGSPPMNLGIEMARGSWIAPSDDDDEMTADHVEVLLDAARSRRLEFVWSKTAMETPHGWQVIGCEPLATGNTTHGAVMWSSGLRFMRMSTTCWKFQEPGDANLWRRMQQIGVKTGFVDRITYKYFLSTIFKQPATA